MLPFALLAGKARLLAAAGLRRVTVSLDSLDDAVFMALNDAAFPVAGVLDAIAAAAGAGLPVKVNMVVKRGCNDQSVLPMAEHFPGQRACAGVECGTCEPVCPVEAIFYEDDVPEQWAR